MTTMSAALDVIAVVVAVTVALGLVVVDVTAVASVRGIEDLVAAMAGMLLK